MKEKKTLSTLLVQGSVHSFSLLAILHFHSKGKLQLLSLGKLVMAEKEMDGCEAAHTDPPDTVNS